MKQRLSALFFFILLSIGLEARINFIHIPKTGGTTISYLFKRNLKASEIYPHALMGIKPHITEKEQIDKVLCTLPDIHEDVPKLVETRN